MILRTKRRPESSQLTGLHLSMSKGAGVLEKHTPAAGAVACLSDKVTMAGTLASARDTVTMCTGHLCPE